MRPEIAYYVTEVVTLQAKLSPPKFPKGIER